MNILRRSAALALLSAAALAVAGCGLGNFAANQPTTAVAAVHLQGNVHGGQQPVAGATIQLYAAGKTGYGSASRAMIGSTVKTAADGSFSITGTYTCQTGDLVYLVATGGNPGVSGTQNNSALAEMAGLGPCSGLSASSFISVNELTTVASVWALAPFMNGIGNVGTTSTNVAGLLNAFTSIGVVANTSSGAIPGPALPAGATLPTQEINALADILAACVNTVDTTAPAAQSSACTTLFTASTTKASTPANTIQAALNLAHTPTLGLATLSGLVSASAPFQPTLTAAPTSWTIAINYVGGGLTNPGAIATDPSGNVWATNPSTGSVSKLQAGTGAPVVSGGFGSSSLFSTPSGIVNDVAGNAWIASKGSNRLSLLRSDGTVALNYAGGGLNQPTSVAIDAAGNIWLTNAGNNTVSEFNSSGTPISPAAGFALGASSGSSPTAIAINPK